MQISILCIIGILTRIVANPVSNVFQKWLTRQGADALFIVGATHLLLSLACLPILLDLPPLPGGFWCAMSLGGFLTVSGNVLIVRALSCADLSILGPINSYKPIVSLLPGLIWLGEFPGPAGCAGIVLIVSGSYFLFRRAENAGGERLRSSHLLERGVQYRLAALVFSALEAVVLKKALLFSDALSAFAVWCVMGLLWSTPLLMLVLRPAGVRAELVVFRRNQWAYLMLFATTALMQLSTTITLAFLQVSAALALFQTSTIIAVVLGWKVFQEKNIVDRLIGSVIMLVGAVVIIVGGDYR